VLVRYLERADVPDEWLPTDASHVRAVDDEAEQVQTERASLSPLYKADAPLSPAPYRADAHLSPAPFKADAHLSPAPYKADAHLSPAPYKADAHLSPGPHRPDATRSRACPPLLWFPTQYTAQHGGAE
jgi:hypothetical protein